MKLSNLFIGACMALCFTSCIKDEALNVEAAIDGCSGANIQLLTFNDIRKEIDVYVLDGANTAAQELIFQLPDGATIAAAEPLATDVPPLYDFSQQAQRKFTVTSEDGSQQVSYSINLYVMKLPLKYSFENLAEKDPYHIFYLTDIDGRLQWASGNPGFKLTGMGSNGLDYPTAQAGSGKVGNCVKLETKTTGSFGEMVNMPIAAGNLFIGSFDVQNAINHPLEATHFGFPFTREPERLTGYYKFKTGSQPVNLSGKDKCDIYAVLYEASQSDFFLDGGNSLNDKSIVLKAQINPEDIVETDEWTAFDLPFVAQNGKSIVQEDLAAGKYKLAVVFSSSAEGAYFKGAIGSTLWIDEVEIICK